MSSYTSSSAGISQLPNNERGTKPLPPEPRVHPFGNPTSKNGSNHRSSPNPVGMFGSAALFFVSLFTKVCTRTLSPRVDLASCRNLIHSSDSVLLYPVHIYPFVGICVSAYLRALGIGTYLHKSVRYSHIGYPSFY